MTIDNSNPIWKPFLTRKEGVTYKCETCLDYGGLIAFNTSDHEGMPFTQTCPDCQGQDDDY